MLPMHYEIFQSQFWFGHKDRSRIPCDHGNIQKRLPQSEQRKAAEIAEGERQRGSEAQPRGMIASG
jgi:hypothetical protein